MSDPKIHLVQLGNPFDTDGAHLVEAYRIADVYVRTFKRPHPLYLYWDNDQLWLARGCNMKGEDFEDAEGYSTQALPMVRNENQQRYPDAEEEFGINAFWVHNNWWTEEAEKLSRTPLAVNKNGTITRTPRRVPCESS